MLLQVAARLEFAASIGTQVRYFKRLGGCLIYYFIAISFSPLLKKQLAAKKSSLLQVAATLPVDTAAPNLAGLFSYQRGWYMRSFIQIWSILLDSNNLQQILVKMQHFEATSVFSMPRRFQHERRGKNWPAWQFPCIKVDTICHYLVTHKQPCCCRLQQGVNLL